MTSNTAQVLTPTATEIAEQSLRSLMRDALDTDPSLSQQKIAREIGTGVSSGTLSQWLSGTYPGDNAKIEAKVGAWYEIYVDRRARAGLPDAPDWYETPTTERIHAGLRYAQLAQDMVCIYGPPGVSKTKACDAYTRLAPGVYMATMTPATKGVLASLREIATAVGLRELPVSASTIQNMIVAKVAHTRGMLIVDESQHLNPEALEQIRSLYDRCAIGMAIVGNEYVYSRMHGGTRAQFLLTLKSRIGRYVTVKGTENDIEAVISAWKIKDRKCQELLREIGRKPGSIRKVTKVLRLAASFAAAQERVETSSDDVRNAWRELGAVE
jgi:DNA transposition AAA+ family ATPase